jgi:hypothetical protein
LRRNAIRKPEQALIKMMKAVKFLINKCYRIPDSVREGGFHRFFTRFKILAEESEFVLSGKEIIFVLQKFLFIKLAA